MLMAFLLCFDTCSVWPLARPVVWEISKRYSKNKNKRIWIIFIANEILWNSVAAVLQLPYKYKYKYKNIKQNKETLYTIGHSSNILDNKQNKEKGLMNGKFTFKALPDVLLI